MSLDNNNIDKINQYISCVKLEVDVRYIRPKVAERKMKLAAGINQTIWIKGVCGCGKTSFVADYLKRKNYDYYSAKDIIPEMVKVPRVSDKRSIVVIDDLYGISEPDLQNEWECVIREMVERDDIWLILISRSAIPIWLHSLSIKNIFYRIDEEDLLLSRSQTDEYFISHNLELKEETKNLVWELGNGHPLWNRVCAIELAESKNELETVRTAQISIWRYLNIHVYDLWDFQMRDAFMKLSVLQSFDLDMAVFMTGNSNINILIKRAMELGNFLTLKDGVWTIRKPMCQSMNLRLNENYSRDYIYSLYVRAGDCLKIKNNLLGALAMYEKAKDERSIAELLIQNANENPSSGHYYEMKHYYFNLSEESIKQSVELMGAMSMLQSILLNVEESERWYDELKLFSKAQSGGLRKEADNKLLYLDISLPHRGSVDLVHLLKHAGNLLFNRKAKLPEFSVTSNLPSQMNGGKDFCEWSRKDKELAASIGKIVGFVLGKYGKGLVSLALAESGFEKGDDNYEVESLAVRGRMEAESGGKIEQCFVGAGIVAWLSIFTNHPENAIMILEGFLEMAKKENVNQQLIKNYNTFTCRIAMYQGRTAQILQWMKEAPNENEEFFGMERFRYLTKVRIYLSDNKYEEAKLLLQKLDYYAQVMKRTYIAMEVKLLQSILFYRMENDKWKELLQEVITEAESFHFVRILSREGAALHPLLKKENLTWQDTQFKKQVEKETAYMAEIYPGYLNTETENAVVVLPENALKILRLQVCGMTTQEIAKQLDISIATVKYHNKETYKKLGVKTKAQAINEARNRKII